MIIRHFADMPYGRVMIPPEKRWVRYRLAQARLMAWLIAHPALYRTWPATRVVVKYNEIEVAMARYGELAKLGETDIARLAK